MTRTEAKASAYHELAAHAAAGVPVLAAFDPLARHAADSEARQMLGRLRERVRAGGGLGEAMRGEPDWFEPFECASVIAGERAGRLAEVLRPLSQHWRAVGSMRGQLLRSLPYPLFVMHAAAVVAALGVWMNEGVPGFARALAVSLCLIYGAGLVVLLLTVPSTVRAMEPFWSRVPLIGPVVRAGVVTRFLLALRLQVENGALYSEALPLSLEAGGSRTLSACAPEAARQAAAGESVLDTLQPVIAYEPELGSAFATAETTGRVGDSLSFVEDRMRERWETGRRGLVTVAARLIYFVSLLLGAMAVLRVATAYYGQVNALLEGDALL
jgi:type II secretory pathway component PulF